MAKAARKECEKKRVLSIDSQAIDLIESSRMTGIAHHKARAVKVHALFAGAHKQMRGLTQGGGAMEVGRCKCGRSIGWTCTNDAFVVGARNTNQAVESLSDAKAIDVEGLWAVVVQPEGRLLNNWDGFLEAVWTLAGTAEKGRVLGLILKVEGLLLEKNWNRIVAVHIKWNGIRAGSCSCGID